TGAAVPGGDAGEGGGAIRLGLRVGAGAGGHGARPPDPVVASPAAARPGRVPAHPRGAGGGGIGERRRPGQDDRGGGAGGLLPEPGADRVAAVADVALFVATDADGAGPGPPAGDRSAAPSR